MYKNLTIASFLGFLAVVLGAFGAHALKDKLSPEALQSFETAVRYQMYHVLLVICINMFKEFTDSFKNSVSIIVFIGLLFFSGSIYLIHLVGIPAKTIWFVTPLGGVFLIIGWVLLFYEFLKKLIKKV